MKRYSTLSAYRVKPSPTKTDQARIEVLFCFAGLAILAVAALADDSLFPNGRWPGFLVGLIFALCGFQMMRVRIPGQTADGPVSSIVAIMVYGMFCILCWNGAFNKNVVIMTMDPETHQTGGPDPNQLRAHIAFGIFGFLCFLGVMYFVFKLIKQLRVRP